MRMWKCMLARKISCFMLSLPLYFFCVRVVKAFMAVVAFSIFHQANAVEIYWKNDGGPQSGSDIKGLCEEIISIFPGIKLTGVEFYSTPRPTYHAVCKGESSSGSSSRSGSNVGSATRRGDTCPAFTTENKITGECERVEDKDKCELLKDTVIPAFKWVSTTDAPSASISIKSCEAAVSGVTLCKNTADGLYACTGTATITGKQLNPSPGTESGVCSDADCNSSDPQRESKQTPCVPVPDGAGGSSCSSSKEESNPGTTKCSSAGGKWTCIESPQSVSKTQSSITTKKEVKNPDGSTTVTTTTITTIKTCRGVRNCTTGTTTTVSTGGKNPDGSDKGEHTICQGPNCNGGGSGGPGDGEGDDEKEESMVSGDMACATLPVCQGDAIACAILRQTHQSRCADESFRNPTEQSIDQLKASLDSEFSGDEYQPLKPSAENTFDMSDMIDTSSRFTAACPVIPPVSFSWVDGTSRSLNFNIDGLCTFLAFMGYLNVAFAMRYAAEILARGFV